MSSGILQLNIFQTSFKWKSKSTKSFEIFDFSILKNIRSRAAKKDSNNYKNHDVTYVGLNSYCKQWCSPYTHFSLNPFSWIGLTVTAFRVKHSVVLRKLPEYLNVKSLQHWQRIYCWLNHNIPLYSWLVTEKGRKHFQHHHHTKIYWKQ